MRNLKMIFAAAIAFTFACNGSSNKKEQSQSADSSAAPNANTEQNYSVDTTKLASGATFYQCEMHPEVISDQPGNCTKCSMALVEMKKN